MRLGRTDNNIRYSHRSRDIWIYESNITETKAIKLNFSWAVRVDLITNPEGKTFVPWRANTVSKVKLIKRETLLPEPRDLKKTRDVLTLECCINEFTIHKGAFQWRWNSQVSTYIVIGKYLLWLLQHTKSCYGIRCARDLTRFSSSRGIDTARRRTTDGFIVFWVWFSVAYQPFHLRDNQSIPIDNHFTGFQVFYQLNIIFSQDLYIQTRVSPLKWLLFHKPRV